MAKDGTARGGQRTGSGRKRKALSEKILEGTAKAAMHVPDLDTDEELQGEDMPSVSEYMRAEQHAGIPLKAEAVFKRTWAFLVACGCEKKVSRNLIEQYSMQYARWIQVEEAINRFGFLAKHPTTGGAMASPYIQIAREYSKLANVAWYQIAQVIRENSEVYVDTHRLQADTMETLLLTGPGRKQA